MSGIATRRFRIFNAQQYFESLTDAERSNVYLFLAKSDEWPDEEAPPAPQTNIQSVRYAPWRNMIACKKAETSDITFALVRYNWVSGTVYTQYDDLNADIYTSNFYVFTEDFNIYKCLYNNNGAASTVKPTGTSTSVIETSDGYVWKFMFSISSADRLKFQTNGFLPVKTLTVDDESSQWDVQQAASNGAIDIINITSGGVNYLENKGFFVNVSNSTVLVANNLASGTDDTYVGSTLFISTGLGSGQIRNIVGYAGSTRAITVDTGFTITPNTSSQYHIGPKISITGDGSGATAYANVDSGTITRVRMIDRGSNYSRASAAVTDGAGSGGVLRPIIPPPGGHGSDPQDELLGHNVIINVQITGTEGGVFPANNDFRVIGLLKNPLEANGATANSSVYNQTTRLTLTGVTDSFQEDEFVNGGTSLAKGRVLTFANTNGNSTEGILSLTNVEGTFAVETITANSTGTSGAVSAVTNPDLSIYSGDIIYIENRALTVRTVDQDEDIKLIVRY